MRNQVTKLDLGVSPEAAVSGGFLIQTEYSAYLLFNAMRQRADGMREDAGTAVVTISRPQLCKFGLPNDEARPGHPVLGHHDLGYEIVEILGSDWVSEAERQNQVRFPNSRFDGLRHFAIAMHDSTFECLAEALSVEVHTEPYGAVVRRVTERALEDPH